MSFSHFHVLQGNPLKRGGCSCTIKKNTLSNTSLYQKTYDSNVAIFINIEGNDSDEQCCPHCEVCHKAREVLCHKEHKSVILGEEAPDVSIIIITTVDHDKKWG